MESKKVTITKTRYVRRDSQRNNNNTQAPAQKENQNNKRKIDLNENIANKQILKSHLTTHFLRTDFHRRISSQVLPLHKSQSQAFVTNLNNNENLPSRYPIFKTKSTRFIFNQPTNPLMNSQNKIINSFTEKNIRRNIRTPQARSNKDFLNNSSMIYYVRCPYCNHLLNKEPEINKIKNVVKFEKKHYNTLSFDNKENIGENLFYNNKYMTEKKYEIKEIRKQENKGHGRFYINENGVIVFSQNDQPTTSITIFSNKPDLSKYINESKVFGKKNNIGIYEGPAPETKVIVRPIKI